MASDIQRYGSKDGLGYYWVKVQEQFGAGYCQLVAVDDLGDVTQTGVRMDYDEAAATTAEAVLAHLSDAAKDASSKLERRRQRMPAEDEKPSPPPMDPATARFYYDPD